MCAGNYVVMRLCVCVCVYVWVKLYLWFTKMVDQCTAVDIGNSDLSRWSVAHFQRALSLYNDQVCVCVGGSALLGSYMYVCFCSPSFNLSMKYSNLLRKYSIFHFMKYTWSNLGLFIYHKVLYFISALLIAHFKS